MERKNSKSSNVMAFIVVAVAFIVLALPGTKLETVEVTPPPHDTVVVIIDTVDVARLSSIPIPATLSTIARYATAALSIRKCSQFCLSTLNKKQQKLEIVDNKRNNMSLYINQ